MAAAAQDADCKHSGSILILTTHDGADLPPSGFVEDAPWLVWLPGDAFDFSQAQPGGQDPRFATGDGRPLPWLVGVWDAARAEAVVWVRVSRIQGHARQEKAGRRWTSRSPARPWLGGWYHNYDSVGELDESRVSKIVTGTLSFWSARGWLSPSLPLQQALPNVAVER